LGKYGVEHRLWSESVVLPTRDPQHLFDVIDDLPVDSAGCGDGQGNATSS
jgi:hypothetical protein